MKTKIIFTLLACVLFVSCEFAQTVKNDLPSTAVTSLEKIVSGMLLFQTVSDSVLIELGSAYSIDLTEDLRGLREALVKIKASLLALKAKIEQEATPRDTKDQQERLDLLKQLNRLLLQSVQPPSTVIS